MVQGRHHYRASRSVHCIHLTPERTCEQSAFDLSKELNAISVTVLVHHLLLLKNTKFIVML
jgi:hypothetical protein